MTPAAERIDETAIEALQGALAAEHAALWCHALAVAFLPPEQAEQSRADAAAHQTLRGALEQALAELGRAAVAAEPAYALPEPVVDAGAAARLAVVAETDALGAWRSVLERTDDVPLRQAGLTALTGGTLRCARWRTVTGQTPAIPDFPGR